MNISKKLAEYEKKYAQNGYDGAGKNMTALERGMGDNAFILKEGTIPILVSAPHGVNHFRCDGKKPLGSCQPGEVHTGGMAELLGELTGCHVMTALSSAGKDYNCDSAGECVYKQALKRYVDSHEIQVVLDIHGANETREFAVEMGTTDENNCSLKDRGFIAELIRSRVEERCSGFTGWNCVTANTMFSASNKNTVTNYISRTTKAACVQLEINWMCRNPKQPERVEAMVKALQDVIMEIAERLSQK